MANLFQMVSRTRVAVVITVVLSTGAWVLTGEQFPFGVFGQPTQEGSRRTAGYPQLVSVAPFPEMDGAMCEWIPASSRGTIQELLTQERMSGSSVVEENKDRTFGEVNRGPARVIRDTFPTYSAIGVDLVSDEVILQDENLFGIKVFDRLDNTPPGASLTEPKRILGGSQTKLEFNCALYIDPRSGDVYSVNNDTLDTMVIFPRGAEGNVAPSSPWCKCTGERRRRRFYLQKRRGMLTMAAWRWAHENNKSDKKSFG